MWVLGYLILTSVYALYLWGQQQSMPIAIAFGHGLYWPVRVGDQVSRMIHCMASGPSCY